MESLSFLGIWHSDNFSLSQNIHSKTPPSFTSFQHVVAEEVVHKKRYYLICSKPGKMSAMQNITTSLNETVTTDPSGDWSQQETIEVTGVGKMSSTIQNVTFFVTNTLATDPRDWSQQQMIVLSVICAFVVLILLLTCYCCRRRKKQSRGSKRSNAKDNEAEIMSPHVVRAQGSFVSASELPKGALLHGTEKLRAAKLDGRGVRVAVIDSGIDKDHTGFNGMVRKQKWYLGGKPLSEDDHGTHVAGTIHFMAPQAELYDYRVFGKRTFGGMTTSQAIVEAIQQAVKDGCHVINMSLSVSYPHLSIHSAVKAAAKKGVVMVCAAGNSGDGDSTTNEMNTYPARLKETISVAAVKKVNGVRNNASERERRW